MRRFSQRNSLVTLHDLNVTPLLDLAFVLLIIFVITTPVLEQGLELRLPGGGRPDRPMERSDIQTVEVSATGQYMIAGQFLPLEAVEARLAQAFAANPNIVVYIRADGAADFQFVSTLVDRCKRHGMEKFSWRTFPE